MFLEFLEYVVMALIVLFVFSQIIIPGYRGTPFFPMFNREKRRLQERLSKAKDEVENAKLKRDTKKEVKKAENIKPKN